MIAGAIVVRGNYDLLSPPVSLSGHLSSAVKCMWMNDGGAAPMTSAIK